MSTDRTVLPITAAFLGTEFSRDIDYLYRGYIIRVEDDGYSVYDPNDVPDLTGELDEVAWGNSAFNVMAAINELVEGVARRKT